MLTPTADDAPAGIGWVPEPIVRDLGLAERGLQIVRADPWAVAPLPGGGRLELWYDVARSAESIRRLSPADAAKWPAFCERMARLARLLETIYLAPPPDPLASERRDLLQLAGLALRARGLGRQGIEDLLRTLPMPVADLLDDWFESDALKGVLGAAGVMHLAQGPRSAGTAFGLLHRHVGGPPGVFHPSRSNFRRALAGLPGIQIRPGAEVVGITVREGRATGVVLASGEEIAAAIVVSGADPKRTLLELVDPGWLDPALVRAVRSIRSRGVVARLTLALDRAPGFSTLVIAPSLDYLERAHDDAKYGRVSRSPWLEATSNGERVDVHVAVRALRPGGRRVGRRARRVARRSRGPGARAASRRIDRRAAAALAGRPRAGLRLARRAGAPGRARARPAAMDAPDPGARALPHADRGPVPLRHGRASGGRGRGRPGRECRPDDPRRPGAAQRGAMTGSPLQALTLLTALVPPP